MTMRNDASNVMNRQTVVGVFQSQADAQQAVRELKAAGFTDEQIGLATQGHHGESDLTHEGEGNKSGTGAVAGATAGLGAGALWGLGIVAGVLPAIGPVIAGGALAAIAASAAGTAVVGGLAGALVGLGIPEEEAEYYHQEFEQGRTVVTVKASGAQYEQARAILDRYNAYDYGRRETVQTRTQTTTGSPAACATGTTNAAQAGQTNRAASMGGRRRDHDGEMVAREEVLHADKHTEQAGEARVRKEVVSERAQVDVPVRREELVVERHPLHGEASGEIREGDRQEERIVLNEEKVDVGKRTVAREAVSVGKRTVTDTEPVQAELKKERIVVDDETDHNPHRPR